MDRKKKIALTTSVVAVGLIAGGAGVAVAGTLDDDATETSISGTALDQASEAALDFVGGGRVTGTEVGDEESLYEVEVTRGDGTQIDVQLDENFAVVGSKTDTEDDE
ncbi:hypothetical protein [Microbacterium terricola]|uniref:PepSY domain-containing protein n=1 Tax=Microbacterium terricola TaxID=344163 RepID=A0ABM8E0Z1_9MICO|nr:hypothetical protein [Microbacterium terricola]UYK40660.1 hypothetical protein OAU46_03125 [Microbacterium terricola]BDV31607.1 hypothetical protein Microterr_22670 [Microbacterium terricola]